MNTWHLDLGLIVLLQIGLLAAYTAYKWKELATPITVGAVVVTLLVLLAQGQVSGTTEPRSEQPSPCVTGHCSKGGLSEVRPTDAGGPSTPR